MGLFNQREATLGRAGAPARGGAATVERTRQIAATPEVVFAALADPTRLAGVLPRVRRVELLERGVSKAKIATHMQISPFSTVRTVGEVRWQEPREIVFTTREPVMVETHMQLLAAAGGTELRARLTLDFSALIGPLAAFMPHDQVISMVAPDLDATLAAIARLAER